MNNLKFCPVCKEDKTIDKFTLNPDGSIRKHVCKRCYARKYNAQMRLEMLEAYGGKCQCCGEDHPYFLALDHIQNDGSEHRAMYESSNSNLIWADAKREGWPKDKYQLLCANCNTAKGHYGVCPHKSGLMAEEVMDDLRSRIFHTGKSLQDYSNNAGLKLGPAASAKIRTEKAVAGKMEKFKNLFAQLSPEAQAKILASYKGDPT